MRSTVGVNPAGGLLRSCGPADCGVAGLRERLLNTGRHRCHRNVIGPVSELVSYYREMFGLIGSPSGRLRNIIGALGTSSDGCRSPRVVIGSVPEPSETPQGHRAGIGTFGWAMGECRSFRGAIGRVSGGCRRPQTGNWTASEPLQGHRASIGALGASSGGCRSSQVGVG